MSKRQISRLRVELLSATSDDARENAIKAAMHNAMIVAGGRESEFVSLSTRHQIKKRKYSPLTESEMEESIQQPIFLDLNELPSENSAIVFGPLPPKKERENSPQRNSRDETFAESRLNREFKHTVVLRKELPQDISRGSEISLSDCSIPVENIFQSPFRSDKNIKENSLFECSHILLVDVENFNILKKMTEIPPDTFVHLFFGCTKYDLFSIRGAPLYQKLESSGCVQITKCGTTVNAADFALSMRLGELNLILDQHVPITILSGDRGFIELFNQMKKTGRRLTLIDPHYIPSDVLHNILSSIGGGK